MSRRPVVVPALLSSAVTLAATLVALVAGPGPAHATEVDKEIGYRCSSPFGSGSSDVRIQVSLPDQVQRGVQVPGRKVSFSIKVPADMVRMLRQYGVDSVSATGKASYTVGPDIKRRIRNLHIPDTDVPASGGMTLRGSGRATAFTPQETGTFAVKVSKTLTATATAHGGIGDGSSVDLTCVVRRGESRQLASLRVLGAGRAAARVPHELATGYACDSLLGGGDAGVSVNVGLPARVKIHTVMKARPIHVTIVVPEELVAQMREQGVTSVSAGSRNLHYRMAGTLKAIKDFAVPSTSVPESGPMTLVGRGIASRHVFSTVGRYPVKVPEYFTAQVTTEDGPFPGLTAEVDCTLLDDVPQRIAVIRAVR